MVKGSTTSAHLRPFIHIGLGSTLLLALELLEAEGHQNISAWEDNRTALENLNAKHNLGQPGPSCSRLPFWIHAYRQSVTKRRKGAKVDCLSLPHYHELRSSLIKAEFSLPSPGQVRRERNDPSNGGTGRGERSVSMELHGSFKSPHLHQSSDCVRGVRDWGPLVFSSSLKKTKADGYKYHQSGVGMVLGHGKGLELNG